MFLAHVGPQGRALVDKRLYLPEEWTGDGDRCVAAGVPAHRRGYRSKTELALEMVEEAQARGYLKAQWVAGDSAFGMSPALREGLAATGMLYVLDVRPDMTVWPLEPTWTDPPYQGNGRPRKPRPQREERQTMAERSQALPAAAWREITIAQGSQGPRVYRFSAQRARVTRRRQPGEVLWAVYRQNRDGSEPRYYLSNAPENTPLETLALWAAPAGALKPSSRPSRATWAWTNTRPAPRIKYGAGSGRVGITTSPCACWPGRSC